ncbi:MAG TPA: PBP1A family penicillin-binding protein [Erythrobacter sp.]|jgi:penicillin-binding protein 1A|uniref:Multimodular transpeptidase-transglycosylase n=1 Tax=Qipengyuania citrea LAMA 915 TaxID=1306953 RepID=A0A0L1KG43_9SPHN|nr:MULTISPECIES: PBP1A family penicillin-binding protein [Alphaproteobacteria]KNH02876.1 Multimodular transpeptidase-transglycosylase [Qipengyuania citrea LAMA 915]HAW36730.1 PBP1A family penicillin-binding protein [Erythrobacter sp.]HBM71114.1 PBP1A family penicillin-binding protein [Erythrobacter sp.]HCO46561.1 PBP1A family penicillin-binding protein [Erythrobacter sp.]|tara:strand:- start:1216 stop:3396 length:2181 start_codon:yes stop_codon:yes gene_type:complete
MNNRRSGRQRTRRQKRGSAAGGTPPGRLRTWGRRLAIWGAALALLLVLFISLAVAFSVRSMPSYYQLKATQTAQTIVVRARDGTEIVELGPSFGKWLTADEIPQVMKDAMISVEDRRYYSHFGIDPVRTGGAIIEGLTGSRARVGGTSTISQQLARNVFLNNNRSLDRKLREAILAMALEWKFSKEQILELYLNKVYFGGGAYGIDSASRKFFSHPATELSVAEAAIIAGLVKAPSRYSPTADVDAAVGRASVVLRLMKEQGRISPDVTVDPSAVRLKEEAGQNSVRYFTDWALPQLDMLLPETFEPIEVWTTLDVGMQRAATASIKANTPDGAQGALVSMDRDGAVLALVGGTDYVQTNYNRATDALRQPGSSWKLFVYLAALEAGYTPDDRVVDTAVTIDGWSPRNSSGRNVGEIDLRTAFAYSINTVAAQLGNEVGFTSVASMARRFGITTEINTYPAMVLGSNEVRLIDMTRAFAAVSARGESVEPYGILKVETADGELLYQHEKPRSSQLVPDYVAAGITDLLQTAVATGTGRAAQIGRPVAGKTGTTSSNKDGYFVGFSSGVTTGVWMGRDDNTRVGGLQGGTAPARAFAAYMRYAVKDRPVEEFDTDLQLPEWQLEPDDEYMFGDPEDYYFIDEQGNLIEPGTADTPRNDPFAQDFDRTLGPERPNPSNTSQPGPGPRPPQQPPRGADGAPQAIGDDFLEEATGASGSNRSPPAQRQIN